MPRKPLQARNLPTVHGTKINQRCALDLSGLRHNPSVMRTQRKTILVIDPSAKDPAGIRRLLADMGHTAVTVAQERAALNLLGSVRFDVIFTGLPGSEDGAARHFIRQLRTVAPGSALVGINEGGAGAANEAWHAECDATIAEPWSPLRVQWVLDFDLRYFGN